MIARVEPLTTARALRGPFDYRIPGEMGDVGVGSVLLVPFGRRRILGLVVDMVARSELPPERLVEPLETLESGVPADLVQLGLWVAEQYCTAPARGLALVLPPGTGTGAAAQAGARTRSLLTAELSPAGRAALENGAGERLGRVQRAVLEELCAGAMTASDLGAVAGAGHGTLASLAGRGLIAVERRPAGRRPAAAERGHGDGGAQPAVRPELTTAQRDALTAIHVPLRARERDNFLLYGVTGSGKTEVYLRAAETVLEQGRGALVLVPEIALTPQTARRFERRFGDRVAVLHSKLGLGERYDEWQRLRRGEARLCVGPRSAVFAPVRDLGLVVIDEEHDSAYKQEGDPRYDARRVAARRAQQAGAVLLVGSATPRPESWTALRRLELAERVDDRVLPPVELLDMRGLRHALHPDARAALEHVAGKGAKAIVLVNRRGWSPFVLCHSCGHGWTCPRCDVTLTLHRRGAHQTLLCHHCGHSEPGPSTCVECGSTSLARHGTGTQRLEAELAEALDPIPVFRLDRDAARHKGGIAALLDSFRRAASGVLVGTQMVAQGHDFPDVELAIVQDADATLRFPDFRAEERTFALVSQLAGRSGRGPGGGRVLVQTLWPESRTLAFAARHDAPGFLAEEIERRRVLRYPPFATLIRVVTSAANEAAAHRAAAQVSGRLPGGDLEVLGPVPLFRVQDRFRSMLLLKTSPGSRAAAVRAVGAAVQSEAQKSRGVKFAVDVDPQ
jgi:primosomal protein N' (replication factor Y)